VLLQGRRQARKEHTCEERPTSSIRSEMKSTSPSLAAANGSSAMVPTDSSVPRGTAAFETQNMNRKSPQRSSLRQ